MTITDAEFDRDLADVDADIRELIDAIRERGWDDELIAKASALDRRVITGHAGAR
jgi:hypothetical protein